MEDGIILIDKPAGMTSFGVVARVRRVLSEQAGKKIKVGHTGTLDPFATGLMILVVGKECKNASTYSKLDKVYEATIKLGQTSSTGDIEGKISDFSDKMPTVKEIETMLVKFVGEITQTPPIFSAIKINGKRAYDMARKGQKIDMPKRQVVVYGLELIDYKYPELRVRANVSSGTYIRALAEDIGEELAVGAYCTELRRISVADWGINQSKKLSEFGIFD